MFPSTLNNNFVYIKRPISIKIILRYNFVFVIFIEFPIYEVEEIPFMS